jgi:hypothetical protein
MVSYLTKLHLQDVNFQLPAGDTGSEGMTANSSPRGALPVPPSLFFEK